MADQEIGVRLTRLAKKRAAAAAASVDDGEQQPMNKKRVVLGELTNLPDKDNNQQPRQQKAKGKAKANAKNSETKLVAKEEENKVGVKAAADDPQMCAEYVSDICQYLRNLEGCCSGGTFLDGVKLSPHVPSGLNDSDIVKLGEFTSLTVKIGGVVAGEDLGFMPRKNPRRGKNPKVEVEKLEDGNAAKLDRGDGRPPRNPTRRGKGKNPRIEVDNSAELELSFQQNPRNQLRAEGVEEPSLQINPKQDSKIKVEIESEEMPESNKVPEVEVKRGRGRPQKNGGVVGRVTRSRGQMSEVESMEMDIENEVVQKKTRGGAASRGRGRGRRGNSKKEDMDIQIVENEDHNDRNSKKEAMQIQEDDNDIYSKGEAMRNQIVENEGEDDNDRSSKSEAMKIQIVENDRNADIGSCGNEEQGSGRKNVRVEELQNEKDNDNVEVIGDSDSKGTDNDNVEVIRHSDEEESVATKKKADCDNRGKAEAVEEFDWEKSTVEEWLDYLEVALVQQIREETEKMIDEMRAKAERVKKYIIEQKIKKAKENAKLS